MARCSHCGTVNRDGAVFCQSCGQRMEEAKVVQPVAGPTCPSCGTTNASGMNFCKMCGSSLVPPAPAVAAAPPPGPEKLTCMGCQKQTPIGFAFCQHCGHKLGGATSPAAPVTQETKVAVAATMMAEAPVLPTPPAGMPRSVGASATGAVPAATASRAAAPAEAFAATMGPTGGAAMLASALAFDKGSDRSAGGATSTVKTSPVRPAPIVEEKIYATLVVVRRDGSDGESVQVTSSSFDIGRSEGGLTFVDDVYLAARHLRFSFENGRAIVRPLETTNGVYVRLRGPVDLHPGDQFLVGKEVIRFEPMGADEHENPSQEHGVRLFGTVPREGWGRLRQITAGGTTRDVWHMARPDLVLGREEGDITFPDDEFMSRRHAAVRRASPRPRLEDLNSSNGTFLRVRGEHTLHAGDLLRLGDQLLRVEL